MTGDKNAEQRHQQVEIVDVWENQRKVVSKGTWGTHRLLTDRPSWSNKKGDVLMFKESYLLPIGYVWVSAWEVVPHGKNTEGWYFAPDYTIPTRFASEKPGALSLVRRRRWIRKRKAVRCYSPETIFSHLMWTNVCLYGFIPSSALETVSNGSDANLLAGLLAEGKLAKQDLEMLSELQQKDQFRQHKSFSHIVKMLSASEVQPEMDENAVGSLGNLVVDCSPSPTSPSLGAKSPGGREQLDKNSGNDDGADDEDYFGRDSSLTNNNNPDDSPFGSISTEDTQQSSIDTTDTFGLLSPTLKRRETKYVFKYGISACLRRQLWLQWCGATFLRSQNMGYFQQLMETVVHEGQVFEEVAQDVVRTAPRHPFFDGRNSPGGAKLMNTLLCLDQHRTIPSYHQAFSYIVAVLLLNMPPEDAFWTMVVLLEKLLPKGFHENYRLQDDIMICHELLEESLPAVATHFHARQIDISVFAIGWLQGLYCAHFPFPSACRILDIIFAEGESTVLVRVLIAFFHLHKKKILECDGSGTLGQFANNWARDCYQVDELITIVSKDKLSKRIKQRRAELLSQPHQ